MSEPARALDPRTVLEVMTSVQVQVGAALRGEEPDASATGLWREQLLEIRRQVLSRREMKRRGQG